MTYFMELQSIEQFRINGFDGALVKEYGNQKPKMGILADLVDMGIVFRLVEDNGDNLVVIANNVSDFQMRGEL